MTNERAIEILNPEHREDYKSIEPIEEACRMGMKALEKQTPRKPIEQGDGINYNCPVCGRYIGYIDAMAWEMTKYCPWCGQMIDWRDFK